MFPGRTTLQLPGLKEKVRLRDVPKGRGMLDLGIPVVIKNADSEISLLRLEP